MNYKIFKSSLVGEFLDKLNQEKTSFIQLYENQEEFLYPFEETDILESNITVHNQNLGEEMLHTLNSYQNDNQTADFECAKLLYENLKLTPAQAGNADFWNYLHHFDMYKYIHQRWKNQGNIHTHIKRHWLLNLTSQKHLINFPLTTLWWSIHLTIDETREDKYELSKVYFSNNRFRTVSLGGMSFVRHKPAILSVLEFMKNHRKELTRTINYTDLGDEISKFINLLGGTKPLSFFDREWFTAKLKERFKIGEGSSENDYEELISEIEQNENERVLCYFCLNNTGNPNYMVSDVKRDDFDYCIEINGANRNGYLLHFYAEGKIKKTKIDSALLDKSRNQMYSNGKCNNLNLVGVKIIANPVLFGIAYVKNDGLTLFKAMDEQNNDWFRTDNNELLQQGKKVISTYLEYKIIKYKILPYSIKENLGTLVQGPQGGGAEITNKYHSEKWSILKQYWPELFNALSL